MCHIRYDGGKYDFWVVPVDDTNGEELQRIKYFFITPAESKALEPRRCNIRCNVVTIVFRTIVFAKTNLHF